MLPKGIEASEIIYLSDIDKYLVLSDDTENKAPIIFLVDSKGNVEETSISGLDRINDMESAALAENGSIFIASSQSHSKKGKLKDDRKLLIKVKRDGKHFKLEKKVLLYDILAEYSKMNNSDSAGFLKTSIADKTLDIEGMFFKDSNLYLGVKSPLLNGSSVILEIKNIDSLMKNEKIAERSVNIWKTFTLKDSSGKKELSGMSLVENTLYITGTTSKNGGLWRLSVNSQEPVFIKEFRNLRPEGVSAASEKNKLALAFDQGSQPSQIGFIKVEK